jgi:hypothetical protein
MTESRQLSDTHFPFGVFEAAAAGKRARHARVKIALA